MRVENVSAEMHFSRCAAFAPPVFPPHIFPAIRIPQHSVDGTP